MARIVQAINIYGPKLELNQMSHLEQVAKWLAMRSGLNKNEVRMVLGELSEAILFYNNQGNPVKLDGIGIFRPSINRKGEVKINFRADTALKKGLTYETYSGSIRNRTRIGLDNQGYKDLWDPDHPDDPLDI